MEGHLELLKKILLPILVIYLITIIILMIVCISHIIKVEVSLGDIIAMIAALLTAVAALGAWKSALASQEQIQLQKELSDREHFFTLLDSLEDAHNIIFIKRNKLYHDLKDEGALFSYYKKQVDECQAEVKGIIERDKESELSSTIQRYQGKNCCLYRRLIDYATAVSATFGFNFKIDNCDYIRKVTGAKIPIDPYDQDLFIFTLDTVVTELLGYRKSDILGYGYGIQRSLDTNGYFEPFKKEYVKHTDEYYKYICASSK